MMKKLTKVAASAWGQRITLLVIICIVMAIFQPVFFRLANIRSILFAISVTGIMSCGMLYTVLVGGLDLSVGSMAGISASVAYLVAQNLGFSNGVFLFGCIVALVICLILGWINGFFVTVLGLPAFVVTLAMKYALYGAIFVILGGRYIYSPTGSVVNALGTSSFLSIPVPVILFVIILLICAFVLGKTTYGHRLYVIGGNKSAARLGGIHSARNARSAFMISSLLAGIAGIILAAMNSQAEPRTGLGYEANVLLAMIVGGINLAGGEGGVPGAIFGALFVGIINNAMLLLSISSDIQSLVQGVVIILAMLLSSYAKEGFGGGLKTKFNKPEKIK